MRDSGHVFQVSFLSIWLALPASTNAQFDFKASDSIKREHYLVLSAENTALQKYLAGKRNDSLEYAAHLLVDGESLINDEMLDLKNIEWMQLKEDLQSVYLHKLVQNMKSPPKRALSIHTYFKSDPGENSGFISWTLEGFARQAADFELVSSVSTFSKGGDGLWERFDSIVADHNTLVSENADESPRGNEYVEVYPVRTFLSRLRTNNADCVVLIKPKFSEEFVGGLPRSVRTSMSVFSRQLQFNDRRKVLFTIGYSEDGEKARDWFISEGARELQNLLGFQSWAVNIGHQ